jgi:hypothetical protein
MYHVAIGDSVNVWTDNADAAWSAFNAAIHSHIPAVIHKDGVALDSFTARGTR